MHRNQIFVYGSALKPAFNIGVIVAKQTMVVMVSLYREEELPFMQTLPRYAYEYAVWKVATVQLNYHISFDKQNYSVPYAYARKKVDVRSTQNLIEIYYRGTRICSHKRLHGRKGQYAPYLPHCPLNERSFSEIRYWQWMRAIIEKAIGGSKIREKDQFHTKLKNGTGTLGSI